MKNLFLMLCLAFFACSQAPVLLEDTQLPDGAFTWRTLSLTARGIKTVSDNRLGLQNVVITMPEVRLRFGAALDAGTFKTKSVITVIASSKVQVAGTATLTYLDGITREPLTNYVTGQPYTTTAAINNLGALLRTPQVKSTERPCVQITFDVTTSLGTNFKRQSLEPICPDVPPIDLAITLGGNTKLYRNYGQSLSLRLTRPQNPQNPIGTETLTISMPGASNFQFSPPLWNAQCLEIPDGLSCVGGFYFNMAGVPPPNVISLALTFDVPDTLETVPLSVTYTSTATETNLSNNTLVANLPTYAPTRANLEVKWLAPTQATSNQLTPLQLIITNRGSSTSTTRAMFFQMYRQLADTQAPSNCGFKHTNYTYACVVPPIAPNASFSMTWTVFTTYQETIQLFAAVYGGSDLDPVWNNQDATSVTFEPDPATFADVSVSLSSNPSPPQQNAGQVFTLTVTNNSSNPALNTRLFDGGSSVQRVYTGCLNQDSYCDLGTIAGNETRVVTLTTEQEETAANVTYYFSIYTNTLESNYNNNSVQLSATYPAADLSISLSSDPDPASQAVGAKHLITLSNTGAEAGTADLELYYSGAATFSSSDPSCSSSDGRAFECVGISLAAGQQKTITLTTVTAETNPNASMAGYFYTVGEDANTSNNYIFQDWSW